MRLPFFTVFLGLLLLPSVNIQTQEEYVVKIKKLRTEDGLLGERMLGLHQDSDGFVWIATPDGLNRFDGYRFKWFNQSNSKLNYRSIRVNNIREDKDGYL